MGPGPPVYIVFEYMQKAGDRTAPPILFVSVVLDCYSDHSLTTQTRFFFHTVCWWRVPHRYALTPLGRALEVKSVKVVATKPSIDIYI